MNIDTMTEREIDIAIATKFGGYSWTKYRRYKGVYVDLLWHKDSAPPAGDDFCALSADKWIPWDLEQYTQDANATREMEAEIQRRGLADDYIEALIAVVGTPDLHLDVWPKMGDLWKLAAATPADRCRAALRVVMGDK